MREEHRRLLEPDMDKIFQEKCQQGVWDNIGEVIFDRLVKEHLGLTQIFRVKNVS